MALRDQPYIPFYVQDFMTDEKVLQCSSSSVGVYVFIMCLMHKSDEYGRILLKQKFKQTDKQIKNFASQLIRHMPFDFHTVANALVELIEEKVLSIENDVLTQKRMVKDGEISELRSIAGKKGGERTQFKKGENSNDFAKAKVQANSEDENENENEVENRKEKEKEKVFLVPILSKAWAINFPNYPTEDYRDFEPLRKIAEFIATQSGLSVESESDFNGIKQKFESICKVIRQDKFWNGKSLSSIESRVQEFYAKAETRGIKSAGRASIF